LENRKLSTNKLQEVRSNEDFNTVSVEDMADLLYESDVLTKRLEEQIVFYQVTIILFNPYSCRLHQRLPDKLFCQESVNYG
jgi:hypothetical protein